MKRSFSVCVATLVAFGSMGCGSGEGELAPGWEGQVDSLPNGTVLVRNDGRGVWPENAGWGLQQELLIGSLDAEGPDNFGRISSFTVDEGGRIWVLEGQAAELRVFDRSGAHVRTVGRAGEGPGEFRQPLRVDMGPDGNAWVMDPQNTRLSVFDSAGNYVEGLRVPGGFVIIPWQGGFDDDGDYYAPVADFEPSFSIALGRFDRAFTPLDTIELPKDPVERASFTIVSDGLTRVSAGVPFQGRLIWRLSRAGTVWALVTDQYRLIEFGPEGDTLRVITKTHEPVAVTGQERTRALDGLRWFTEQGGKVDASKIPHEKPLANAFFVDEAGYVWVALEAGSEADHQPFHVFNPTGQFLGTVVAPFRLQTSPSPIVRDGLLYGIVRDEMDVQYVVRARITKP